MLAPKADGFSYTRHWHFAATGRLALLGRCAGTNQLGGLDQVAKDADLIQAYGLQVCVAATGNQLVENVGMGQKVFVHDQDDCPVHPVDSKRLQLVVYRRVQVRQSGNRRVAGHSADSGGWRGARVNRPAVRTKQGAKGSQTVLAHAEDGSDMADWAHSAVRDAPENCPPGSDCQDRIAKIGLPRSDCLSRITRRRAIVRRIGTDPIPSACRQTGREAGPRQSTPPPRREPTSTRFPGPKPS